MTPGRCAVLGLVEGPTELLPVSSSAHLRLLPWVAGWEWDQLDPELQKSVGIAAHAGAAAALVFGQREHIRAELLALDARRLGLIGLSFAVPALVGLRCESWIERRLGTPVGTAAGLMVGSVAMALADRRPQDRDRDQAGALDGLALGVGQAGALVPGVSRNGATLTAARLRRFNRADSNFLSRMVALPVIAGAAALKLLGLRRRGVERELGKPLAAASGAAFASTLASQRLITLVERDRALWPYSAYRCLLAGLVLLRARRGDG